MDKITSSPGRVRLAVLTMAAGLLLAGCSGGGDPAPAVPTDSAALPARTVLPTTWIDATTKAWPDSDGRRNGIMVVAAGARRCALGEERVRALDIEFRWGSSGYGPLDSGTDAANSFVHRCELSDSHRLPDYSPAHAAGVVVLTRYADVADLQQDVARFRSQTDTPVQDNEVSRLLSGRYPVDALRRWYPTNPQGLYQAMVIDEQQRATLLLEVNSLSRADFEAGSAQKVADALTDFLERSHPAPAAAPPVVPEWAGSLWEDADSRFRIPIAKGWNHDLADGRMEDPTALPKFSNSDRSASVVVLPTGLPEPRSLSAVVEKARTAYATRPGTDLLSEEPMTLDDGTSAQRMDYTLSGGKRLMSVLVVTRGYLFQIIGTARADRWESTQADMLRMARSFTAR